MSVCSKAPEVSQMVHERCYARFGDSPTISRSTIRTAIKSEHLIDSLERLNTGINRLTDLVERLKEQPPLGLTRSSTFSRLLEEVPQTNLK
jgi:hypothetical protein